MNLLRKWGHSTEWEVNLAWSLSFLFTIHQEIAAEFVLVWTSVRAPLRWNQCEGSTHTLPSDIDEESCHTFDRNLLLFGSQHEDGPARVERWPWIPLVLFGVSYASFLKRNSAWRFKASARAIPLALFFGVLLSPLPLFFESFAVFPFFCRWLFRNCPGTAQRPPFHWHLPKILHPIAFDSLIDYCCFLSDKDRFPTIPMHSAAEYGARKPWRPPLKFASGERGFGYSWYEFYMVSVHTIVY